MQIVADSVATSIQTSHHAHVWMIIAIVEFIAIILLLFSRNKQDTRRSAIKKQVLSEGDVDWGGTINNAYHAEPLYKKLIVACHPDRFAPDANKMAIATDITMRINQNKHDIEALKALSDEAKNKLNINL